MVGGDSVTCNPSYCGWYLNKNDFSFFLRSFLSLFGLLLSFLIIFTRPAIRLPLIMSDNVIVKVMDYDGVGKDELIAQRVISLKEIQTPTGGLLLILPYSPLRSPSYDL